MKITEFRKLIREEVRKVVKENEEDFRYMKPFTKDIQQAIKNLQVLNDKIETVGPLSEDIVDALEALEVLYNKIIKTPIREEGDIKDPAVVAAEKAAAAADIKAKELALNNAKKKLSNTR